MKVNKKPKNRAKDPEVRLAGGFGNAAAAQGDEALLRRSVMANLLWEDNFYEDGVSITENIIKLVPRVSPDRVASIAIEAKLKQKLRHVPLFLAVQMLEHDKHKRYVGDMEDIIQRVDDITEILALYWKNGRRPLAKQLKKLLRNSFDLENVYPDGNVRFRFDAYNFAKYNRKSEVKLRDVMRLVHPRPSQGREDLFRQIKENCLPVPDTWEVALSAGKNKIETWTRLIKERKLGGLAFIRNLRNMEQARVPDSVIIEGFNTINVRWLLPLTILSAAKESPKWERELEQLLFKVVGNQPKLPGYTILIVDVSGSMNGQISGRSRMQRIDAAAALAMVAAEQCEHIRIYATAGNDPSRIHKTKLLKPRRGFALIDEIKQAPLAIGGGGIFTRQCLEYIKTQETEKPDRILVFSDSQDCDHPSQKIPTPFGKKNYIIDIGAHARGINYKGVWDAEISSFSEHFLDYINASEGLEIIEQDG